MRPCEPRLTGISRDSSSAVGVAFPCPEWTPDKVLITEVTAVAGALPSNTLSRGEIVCAGALGIRRNAVEWLAVSFRHSSPLPPPSRQPGQTEATHSQH